MLVIICAVNHKHGVRPRFARAEQQRERFQTGSCVSERRLSNSESLVFAHASRNRYKE
jgi:hypothetical protein